MDPRQRVAPMLAYEDGAAAMDWLMKAFGLEEGARWLDEMGRLSHGELTLGGQSILLAEPTPLYQSPIRVRRNYAPAAEWAEVPWILNGVLLYVEDIDAAYARATEAKAKILGPIEEGPPGPRFRVEDPEGHRWFLMELPR